jgi:nitroreductase
MELSEVMRTTGAAREFRPDPVEPGDIRGVLDDARFAPSGGNRQGWRIIEIKNPAIKHSLADLSLPAATRYVLQMQAGESPFNTIHPSTVSEQQIAEAEPPDWFVAYIRHAPTLLVVTVDLSLVASMDSDLDRTGVISGASIYPLVWNILLAARNEGYGGTITTMAVTREPEVQKLLGLPASWAVAAVIPLGKPVKQLSKLKRKPVEDILFTDSWSGD